MSPCSTALEPGVQLQSGLAESRVKHLTGRIKAHGLPAAGLLAGILPPHIPGLLSAVMQGLSADLPLPQVPDALP